MSEWQDIDTAPEDDGEATLILICRLDHGEMDCRVVFRCDDGSDYPWVIAGSDDCVETHWPTHWMPLPKPPVQP